jgi:hypothetical protein
VSAQGLVRRVLELREARRVGSRAPHAETADSPSEVPLASAEYSVARKLRASSAEFPDRDAVHLEVMLAKHASVRAAVASARRMAVPEDVIRSAVERIVDAHHRDVAFAARLAAANPNAAGVSRCDPYRSARSSTEPCPGNPNAAEVSSVGARS